MMDETLSCLAKLRVGHSRGRLAPNKPCLLLAIICEVQSGHITTPTIAIDDRLISRYFDLYEAITGQRQPANPQLPLWHLKSDQGRSGPLWQPLFAANIATLAPRLGQPKSIAALRELFTEALFDPELFKIFQNSQKAHDASALLVTKYLYDEQYHQKDIHRYLTRALDSSEYEKHPEALIGNVIEERQQQARSAAFRSLVLEAYDYRCAASRLRYITPDYRYLVEAAHLVPFSESQDDRPTNGLALTPNLHWAMDNHLIAPGPDLQWHVSPGIDRFVTDNSWLWELDGQSLVLPRSARYQPDREALVWRMDHLQQ
ncbi:HNH endonuclease [Halomonas sp. ISL-60]|uniref:HNH endonuclease n=1 Tax=Halomonas sp. ISL-56 TaxID=2819149 RepID=UPI001BE56FFE|nr:HNH endonuclease [Halomonas sp. ISL-56]MBT2771868.1 HNH endonuclease [Halomonas sp. ISL-60]MBT2800167.1 HNH endonuclease [Halomonas sp. ISL-56]